MKIQQQTIMIFTFVTEKFDAYIITDNYTTRIKSQVFDTFFVIIFVSFDRRPMNSQYSFKFA